MDDNVYRSDQTGKWVKIGVNASDLAVSSDGGIMVINKAAAASGGRSGTTPSRPGPQQPFNQAATAVAIPNAQRTVVVGKDTNNLPLVDRGSQVSRAVLSTERRTALRCRLPDFNRSRSFEDDQ